MRTYNRVKVRAARRGNGDLDLGDPYFGFQTFAAAGVPDGGTVSYVLEDDGAWVTGVGVFDLAHNRLVSRTVEDSSGGSDLIALSVAANVLLTPNAADYAGLPDPRCPAWPGPRTLCIDNRFYLYEMGRIIRELDQAEIDALLQSVA